MENLKITFQKPATLEGTAGYICEKVKNSLFTIKKDWVNKEQEKLFILEMKTDNGQYYRLAYFKPSGVVLPEGIFGSNLTPAAKKVVQELQQCAKTTLIEWIEADKRPNIAFFITAG